MRKLAPPEALGFSAQRLARITTVMSEHVDRGEMAGAITLVARRGQVLAYQALVDHK
jgi:hypothetical protein